MVPYCFGGGQDRLGCSLQAPVGEQNFATRKCLRPCVYSVPKRVSLVSPGYAKMVQADETGVTVEDAEVESMPQKTVAHVEPGNPGRMRDANFGYRISR